MRSKPSPVAIGLSLVMLFFSRASMAQQTQQSTEQAKTVSAPPTDQPAAPKLILKDGTDVQLKFAQDLTSKTAAEGDPVSLVLDQDLKVGDVVVVKAGAKAVGTITHSKKAGMMGKAGELNMRLEYLIAGDNRVKLRGSKGKEGEGKEGATVALTVLFGPIGLIKHGKNVEIKDGTPLLAYLDENYPVPAANPK
jgi:glucose/arabinose dehydrogenase